MRTTTVASVATLQRFWSLHLVATNPHQVNRSSSEDRAQLCAPEMEARRARARSGRLPWCRPSAGPGLGVDSPAAAGGAGDLQQDDRGERLSSCDTLRDGWISLHQSEPANPTILTVPDLCQRPRPSTSRVSLPERRRPPSRAIHESTHDMSSSNISPLSMHGALHLDQHHGFSDAHRPW